jgi:hypothetical protein
MEGGDTDGAAASVPGIMKSKSFNSKALNRHITSMVRPKTSRNPWSSLVFLFLLISV